MQFAIDPLPQWRADRSRLSGRKRVPSVLAAPAAIRALPGGRPAKSRGVVALQVLATIRKERLDAYEQLTEVVVLFEVVGHSVNLRFQG